MRISQIGKRSRKALKDEKAPVLLMYSPVSASTARAFTPQNWSLTLSNSTLGSSREGGFVVKNSRAHLSGEAEVSPGGGYHLAFASCRPSMHALKNNAV